MNGLKRGLCVLLSSSSGPCGVGGLGAGAASRELWSRAAPRAPRRRLEGLVEGEDVLRGPQRAGCLG